MRAPFQILAVPYRINKGIPEYCVFHRSDFDIWQFIAGGGEDSETPAEAAKREIFEECGVTEAKVIPLKSVCSIPTGIFPKRHLYNWDKELYVIPEYSFAFEYSGEITLSDEHTEYKWLSCVEAERILRYDSNKTALYELNCILTAEKII